MPTRKISPSKQPKMGELSEFLERVKEIRRKWSPDSEAQRRGDRQPLWFRGHADADWKLTPKLYRKEFLGADEEEIRQEFQSRALQLIQTRIPADKWEWYFLMQHYGAPTRLLDWTENVLAALYFALEDHPGTHDAAVWILDPDWLNRKLKKGIEGAMLPDWSEAGSYLRELEEAFEGRKVTASLPAAIEPPHVDRRLAAQASRFVIFGKTQDLMRTKAARTARGRRVGSVRIPAHYIKAIQRDLEDYGITTAAIYPDLDGLCRDICRKWKKW